MNKRRVVVTGYGMITPLGKDTTETFDRAAFLGRVATQLAIGTDAADRLSRAVFAAARARLPSHEVIHIENQLPRDLLKLFRG